MNKHFLYLWDYNFCLIKFVYDENSLYLCTHKMKIL